GADIVDVTFGDGVFVLLDKRGGIWTGDGRGPWQRGSLGANPKEIETCSLAFGNGRWVAAANWDAGIVFTTTDPRGAWTRVNPPTTVGMLSRVVHGPSGFVIAGNGVSTAKSRDGTTWEAGPELFMDGPTWDLVATRESYYLWRDMHARSTDGLEWEVINP